MTAPQTGAGVTGGPEARKTATAQLQRVRHCSVVVQIGRQPSFKASPHQPPTPRSRPGSRLDRHAHRGEAFEELLRLLGLDVLEPPRKIVRARFPDLGQESRAATTRAGSPFGQASLAAFLPFAALAGTAVSSPASTSETWVAALVPCGF